MTALTDEARAHSRVDRIFAEYTGGPYPRGDDREAFLVDPAHVIVPTFG